MVSRLKRPRVCLVFDAHNYVAVQTRAANEMGAKACPLNMDRGSPMKRLRRESASHPSSLPATPAVSTTVAARAVLGHETVPR